MDNPIIPTTGEIAWGSASVVAISFAMAALACIVLVVVQRRAGRSQR